MRILYDEDNDILIISNPTGDRVIKEVPHSNNVTIAYDIYGKAIAIEFIEASIFLHIPKDLLKNLSETRNNLI